MSESDAFRPARAARQRLSRRSFAVAALAAAGLAAAGSAAEPLVLRVADAIGAPGQQTAIVFRTYASRPVRRGRLSLASVAALRGAASPLGSSPFSSLDLVQIFSSEGDVINGTITFNPGTGDFDINFESASATINWKDGVLGVLYVTVGAGSLPGFTWPLTLDADPLFTFLTDPDDDDQVLELRPGEIFVRNAMAPLAFEVDGGKVHPGSGASIELGTAEKFAIESGRIVLDYESQYFSSPPTVQTDPRHGTVSVATSYPQAGRVQIDFTSSDDTFNLVPGDILRLDAPTVPGTAVGTISPLTVVAAQSFLKGPGAVPLNVLFASGTLEFENHPSVYSDNFETGDYWIWSSVATP